MNRSSVAILLIVIALGPATTAVFGRSDHPLITKFTAVTPAFGEKRVGVLISDYARRRVFWQRAAAETNTGHEKIGGDRSRFGIY